MSPGWITGIVVAVLLGEVLVYWAAAALAEAPDTGWGKFLVTPGTSAVICAGLAVLLFYVLGLTESPLAPDKRISLYVGIAGVVALTWIIPALLFGPILSVSFGRSMFIAILQVLLRLFL